MNSKTNMKNKKNNIKIWTLIKSVIIKNDNQIID